MHFNYGKKKKIRKGILHLIPTPIGNNPPFQVIPISVKKEISSLTNFIVESERNARRFIKKIIRVTLKNFRHKKSGRLTGRFLTYLKVLKLIMVSTRHSS